MGQGQARARGDVDEASAGGGSTFDLPAELARLHHDPAYARGTRVAKTLVKAANLRIVLVAMKAGGRLDEHVAPGPISIYAVAGKLRVNAPQHDVELITGQLIVLPTGARHSVAAMDESAFLLTIAWPSERASALVP